VIIIMAMVTVNLSKVALIKTETSNAADAGAIAAGSAMASLFNSLAQANSYMITAYEEFMVEVSVLFIEAVVALVTAQLEVATAITEFGVAEAELDVALAEIGSAIGLAYELPGAAALDAAAAIVTLGAAEAALALAETAVAAAIVAIGDFISTMWGILISVTAFYGAQYYIYCNLRDTAEEGRYSALKMGHGYAFSNSGTAGKLTDSQKDDFEAFTDAISDDDTPAETYTYSWSDGQGRGHSVTTNVTTQLLDHFQLQVALLPFPVEEADLIAIITLAEIVEGELGTVAATFLTMTIKLVLAEILLFIAEIVLWVAEVFQVICCGCGPWCPYCCAACALWIAWSSIGAGLLGAAEGLVAAVAVTVAANLVLLGTVEGELIALDIMVAAAWAGLAPGDIVDSTSCGDAWTWIILWMVDLVHDRRISVSCAQSHGGGDYGFWETTYPDTYSSATVDFSGNGDIYEPVMRYDASIVSVE